MNLLVCEYLEKVRELIRVDPSISQPEIASQLDLDLGTVRTIVDKVLGLAQLKRRWTSATLSDTQRKTRLKWASSTLKTFKDGDTKRIAACFDSRIYKCSAASESSRVITEYWTFESGSSVAEKRVLLCLYSAAGVAAVASSCDLENGLDAVAQRWRTTDAHRPSRGKKRPLYVDSAAHLKRDFLRDRGVSLVGPPESSADLALGGSFLEPAFWTSLQQRRFATHEDALTEYANCLFGGAVAEMWDKLFECWLERLRECVRRDGDYVEPIIINEDLNGCDAASIAEDPNEVALSRTPTPSDESTTNVIELRDLESSANVQAHIVPLVQTQQRQFATEHNGETCPKPSCSFTCLSAMALKNSRTGRLRVSEIYDFMCEHFPYFRTAPKKKWQNSVRHNLSENKCFKKIGPTNKRNGLWAIEPTRVHKLDAEVHKWSRKDPLAIKKAMIYPDHLELLQRGEMRFPGNVSEETEASSDEGVREHRPATNSVTGSYDESSRDCDDDAMSNDEIDKNALHEYLPIPSAKRQKMM